MISRVLVAVLVLAATVSAQVKNVNDQIKEIVKQCSKDPKCVSLVREVKIVDSDSAKSESVVFLRTSTFADMRIMRFKAFNGSYIVFTIPEHTVDMGLVRIFEGK